MQGLLSEDYSSTADTALVDNAWRGAEAYHYFMLTQRQLYTRQLEASLKTVHNMKHTTMILSMTLYIFCFSLCI